MMPVSKLSEFVFKAIFILFALPFHAQEIQKDTTVDSQLQMKFPAIYFKHNSINYAEMLYTVDSCYKYIAEHAEDIREYVIWRDSAESEHLSKERIKIIKAGLKTYKAAGISIKSMNNAQKISRSSIDQKKDPQQIQYLLTLNSVFEISQIHEKELKKGKVSHADRPRWWCPRCYKRHAFKRQRDMRRMQKSHS